MDKKSKRTASSSSYFPVEITEIILSKLSSVKSLLRFKAVSKSWNTIISDPLFVQNHLQSSNSPNDNLFLRLDRDCSAADKSNFSLIKFEGQKIRVVEAVLKKPYFSNVLCECNGVILLTDSSNKNREYVLWNPSTQSQIYFQCPYEFNQYYVNHGICYNSVTNDFKVILISEKKYAIYSCKKSSWKRKRSRTRYEGVCSGIFVDGATFWILQDCKSRQLIVYFDPKTEELKNLWKPKELNGDGRCIHLASLRGRLCLFCNNINGYEKRVQIWIKEKGGFENYCWNEFITIENMWPWNHTWMHFGPVCYVGNKIVIRLYEGRFVYYCPSEKTLEYFEQIGMYGCKIIPYRNSLYFPRRKGNIGPEEAMAPQRF